MRDRIVRGALAGSAVLLALDALALRAGLASGLLPKLAGSAAWVTSRAAGVTAFLALTIDVIFGLLLSTGATDRVIPRATSLELHRWTSAAALVLTGVHALALLGDRWVRFDVIDLVVPLASSYRPIAVGLGVVAAHGLLVVHLSFGWRKRLGPKAWRRLHYASFGVFLAALAHGLLAGSDTAAPGLRLMYLVALAGVGGLVVLRAGAGRARGA
ncbi:MAG: ferric reductase-like transmembrane domain-containing protein [Polyangiaceae bacterium]|nr:ferric reductase-like transmembrane domain-containing protein [Polyangiaceae bacterium]